MQENDVVVSDSNVVESSSEKDVMDTDDVEIMWTRLNRMNCREN